MKVPHRIYYKGVEYIPKNIVDDMLATAEDHAYFAGSENEKEKSKKEAYKEYVAGYKAAKEECLEPYQLGFKNGKERTIEKACEFIETYPHLFMGVLRSEVIEDFKKYIKGE